jgi:hypothetical protein
MGDILIPPGPTGPTGATGPTGPTGATGPSGGGNSSFQNVASFEAASITASVQTVNVQGYSVAGDAGAQTLVRVTSNLGTWCIRSADRFLPNGSQTLSSSFGAILSSTTGSILTPVTSNGTNWIIG